MDPFRDNCSVWFPYMVLVIGGRCNVLIFLLPLGSYVIENGEKIMKSRKTRVFNEISEIQSDDLQKYTSCQVELKLILWFIRMSGIRLTRHIDHVPHILNISLHPCRLNGREFFPLPKRYHFHFSSLSSKLLANVRFKFF